MRFFSCNPLIIVGFASLFGGFVTSLAPTNGYHDHHHRTTTSTTSNHRNNVINHSQQRETHAHSTTAVPSTVLDRRSLVKGGLFATALAGISACTAFLCIPTPANAAATATAGEILPMVTTDEFLVILRDSARSIQEVDFSGPKSEIVTVKLVDGTAFGIKDVVESSTDPRSPLRIAAFCRESQVRSRFLNIEQALASAPKRKKMYTNERVVEANAREKERLARIQQDEQERLAELYRMQQEEEKAASAL